MAKLDKAPASKAGDSRFEPWLPRRSTSSPDAGPLDRSSLHRPRQRDDDTFVPPLIRSALGTLALLTALALLSGQAEATQCKGGDARPAKLSDKRASKAVLCLVNKERRGHGLRPLRRQAAQAKAARKHNDRMVRTNCFSHRCPGERDLVGRLTAAGYLPCNCSWGVGENIAYGSGRYGTPRNIVDVWMRSSGHRANILNGAFEHIGVAVASGTPTAGRSRDAATYTTDFGYKR